LIIFFYARWTARVIDWTPVDGRLCVLRVRRNFFNLSITNAHAPHNDRPDEKKELFFSLLEKTYKKCPRHDVRIVIGDFNAQAWRKEVFRPTISRRLAFHRESNENGSELINFAASHNMVISSTLFRRKNIHKATWVSAGEDGTKTQIDHGLIDGTHASDVLNVRTYRCKATDNDHHYSDHFLLGTKIKERISNVFTSQSAKSRRLNIAALQISGKRREFGEKLDSKLSDQSEVTTAWAQVCNAMNEVAEEVVGFDEPVQNEWLDDDC
jgi:Endonuclease-reverse transcriptase